MKKSRKIAYIFAATAGISLLSTAAIAAGYGNGTPVRKTTGTAVCSLEALAPAAITMTKTAACFREVHAFLAPKTAVCFPDLAKSAPNANRKE